MHKFPTPSDIDKALLRIWWHMKEIIYCELLKPERETVTALRYSKQSVNVNETVAR